MIVRPSTILVNPNAYLQATINVRFYGAVGDGVTDDTAAIQAAIDSIPLLGTGVDALGCSVYFPPGVYITTSVLTVNQRRVVLFGHGMNGSYGTEIRHTDANTDIINFVSDQCSCYGLFFSGTGQYPGTAGTGNGLVLGTGPSGYTMSSMAINNCAFANIPRKAVLASYVDSIYINNCQFENSGGGVDFVGQANTPGYALGNLEGSEIEGCLFSNLYDGAITIQNPGGGYNQIVGNSFWGCGYPLDSTRAAIRIANSGAPETRTMLISSNKFRANVQDILVVGPTTIGTSGISNINVVGNASDQAHMRAMYFNGVGNLLLVGNHVHDANADNGGLPAVEITGTSVGVLVDGNKIGYSATNAQTYGLTLGASVSGIVLGVNDITGKTGNINLVAGASFKANSGSVVSWTPTVKGSSTAGTPTYSVQTGTYSVQGNLCFFSCKVVLTATTGIAGNILIGGFPLASRGLASLPVGYVLQGGAAGYVVTADMAVGASDIDLNLCKQDPSAGTTTLAIANIGAGFRIELSGVILI